MYVDMYMWVGISVCGRGEERRGGGEERRGGGGEERRGGMSDIILRQFRLD